MQNSVQPTFLCIAFTIGNWEYSASLEETTALLFVPARNTNQTKSLACVTNNVAGRPPDMEHILCCGFVSFIANKISAFLLQIPFLYKIDAELYISVAGASLSKPLTPLFIFDYISCGFSSRNTESTD